MVEIRTDPRLRATYARSRPLLADRGVDTCALDRFLAYLSSHGDGTTLLALTQADEDLSAVGFIDPASHVLVGWDVTARGAPGSARRP